jgi:CBS domain-containing protein
MSPRLLCSDGPPIMTIPLIKPLVVKLNDKVSDVAKEMKKRDISIALVLDDEGKLIGTLSDRDIVTKIVAEGRPVDTPVSVALNRDPLKGRPTWSLGKALEAMAAIGARHMVVIDDDGKPLGVLNIKDLVRHIIEDIDVQELVPAE